MKTLHGTLLRPESPTDCKITADGIVRIDDDGRFAEVGADPTPSGDVIGGEGCWVLPGFVDAHLHLPQWDRRGLDGLTLFDWHDKVVYPAEARFTNTDFAERLAEDFVSGMIRHGTTTVAAFGSPHAKATGKAFEVFARRGMRAIYGMMLNDTNCPDDLIVPADRALDQARELASKWHGAENGRLQYAFNPRVPICCTEKLMRGAAALAKMMQCYIQSHAGESIDETAALRDSFPENMDDIDVFAELGLLTPRTLLGHGVVLNHDERRQVAEARTALVHCPTANLFLESGLMDYHAHRKAGIRIALGSSIAGGSDPFMPRVAVECLQTAKALKVHAIPRGSHKVPSPSEAWWMLTAGGAEALSMGDRIGRIKQGHEADCLIVRPEPWIAELSLDLQASALLYTLRPDQIEHVFIAGRRVGP